IIGIPKEIKSDEYRVGATPHNVAFWISEGHRVYIQKGAGEGSGFEDEFYIQSGASMVSSIEELYEKATLIVKIKEPQPLEYQLLNDSHILFCYLHLASSKELTQALLQRNIKAIAYETVTKHNELPLLKPMSEIAGKSSVISGAYYLSRYLGGQGVLMGGALGVSNAKVLIIGAGNAGKHAAKYALGLDGDVTVINRSTPKLEALKDMLPSIKTEIYSPKRFEELLYESDLVISSVLIHGGSAAPKLITNAMLSKMKKGSVFIDISIDQGGIAQSSKATTHSDPIYIQDGVLHYCVANIPGAYPKSATLAITNATAPYVNFIAKEGFKSAIQKDRSLYGGVNIYRNHLSNQAVANLFEIEYQELDEVLE
ncbi:MAG: alanine dehydrogenase, partial [Campylobacterota bacterium]|nr:alanine dehydrogenase [Campylobacterota bacterium]